METFKDTAQRLMKEAGLSYHQTGVRMGIPENVARQVVWRFINGTNPSVAMVVKFANAVGADVEELL